MMTILIRTRKSIWHISLRGICRVSSIDWEATEGTFKRLLEFQLAFAENDNRKFDARQGQAWRELDDNRLPPVDNESNVTPHPPL